jgi:hypothetical protein
MRPTGRMLLACPCACKQMTRSSSSRGISPKAAAFGGRLSPPEMPGTRPRTFASRPTMLREGTGTWRSEADFAPSPASGRPSLGPRFMEGDVAEEKRTLLQIPGHCLASRNFPVNLGKCAAAQGNLRQVPGLSSKSLDFPVNPGDVRQRKGIYARSRDSPPIPGLSRKSRGRAATQGDLRQIPGLPSRSRDFPVNPKVARQRKGICARSRDSPPDPGTFP